MAKSSIPEHPSGETMKAVCFQEFGKSVQDTLAVKDIPKPSVDGPKQVLIKVRAASLNPIDKVRVAGQLDVLMPETHTDSVLGYDASGVVEEVGSDVSLFKKGDEVFVRTGKDAKYGTLAEYLIDVEECIGCKPKKLSFEEAASVPLAGLTALKALRRGGAKEGSKVFISAGSGGVGCMAIQIAKKMLGVSHVCVTASAGPGADLCKSLGADRIINYRDEDFSKVLAGEDFDMCLDATDEAVKMAEIVKEGGKVISIAGVPTIEAINEAIGQAGWMVRIFMYLMRNSKAERAVAARGATWEYIFMNPSGEDLNAIAKHLEDGSIRAVLDKSGSSSSIDEFHVAAEKLWSSRAKGKTVITISS